MNKRTQSDTTDNELTLQQQKFHAAKKSTLISVIVNMLLSLWQIIIGFISHSQGLIADGIHTLSDLIADFVVLIANKKAISSLMTIIPTDIFVTKMEHL